MTRPADIADPPGDAPTDPATADLETLRERGDPLADDVIAAELARDRGRRLREVLQQLGPNEVALPADVDGPLGEYLHSSQRLPSWADPARILAGQRLFVRHAPLMILLLYGSALPRMYSLRHGVQVLARSGRLSQTVDRRLVQTARFLVDVLTPHGLGPGGRGVRSIQKVRLIHAMIRHHLARSEGWDPAWGRPINLQDQLVVALQLSIGILDGGRRLGVELSPGEEDAYVHTWAVVGAMLGIDDVFLPRHAAEARARWAQIDRTQRGETAEGVRLTRELVGHLGRLLPGRLLRPGFVHATIVHLLGEDAAASIGVHAPRWTRSVMLPVRLAATAHHRLGHRHPLVEGLHRHAGEYLLRRVVAANVDPRTPDYVLPRSLTPSPSVRPFRLWRAGR